MEMYTSNPGLIEQIELSTARLRPSKMKWSYVYSCPQSRTLQNRFAPLTENLAVYFEEFRTEIKNQYETIRARHIIVTDESTATELMSRIESGEITFGEAALHYSIDSGTAANGGELGSLQRGQTVPEFEEAILTAPIGKLYGPEKASLVSLNNR